MIFELDFKLGLGIRLGFSCLPNKFLLGGILWYRTTVCVVLSYFVVCVILLDTPKPISLYSLLSDAIYGEDIDYMRNLSDCYS